MTNPTAQTKIPTPPNHVRCGSSRRFIKRIGGSIIVQIVTACRIQKRPNRRGFSRPASTAPSKDSLKSYKLIDSVCLPAWPRSPATFYNE